MISRLIYTEGFFVVLILLLVLASFSPVLFGGYIFFGEEQIGFYYPHSHFFAKSLQDGTSLFWNNGYYAGVPVAFEQFVSAYFPLNRLLFSFLPYLSAHHLSIFLGTLLGCLMAYWFGRANALSPISSFLLSVSYLLSTTFGWLSIGTLAAWSFFMIPVIFLSLFKAKQGVRWGAWTALGGMALGVGFLAGFLQIVVYGFVLALCYALWLDFSSKGDTWWRRLKTLKSFFLMSVIGGLWGSLQFLPSLLIAGLSIRTNTYAIQQISGENISKLLSYVFPEYISVPFIGGGGVHGFYAGALPILVAILGMLVGRKKPQLFFAALYAGILWVAFHLPPFSWLNDHLFPFSHFSSSFRWTVAGAWPLAVLAAFGFENILQAKEKSTREIQIFRIFKWVIVIIILGSIAASVFISFFASRPDLQERFLSWYLRGKEVQFSYEHYFNVLRRMIEEVRSSFSIFDWHIFLPLLFFPASLFLIRYFREGHISRVVFMRGAALLLIVNVLIIPLAMLKSAYVSADLLEKEPEIIKVIKAREENFENFRIMGFLLGESVFWQLTSKKLLAPDENAKLLREILTLDINTLYGLDRLDGAWYYRTLRHNQILDTVLFPRGLTIFDKEKLVSSTEPLRREYNIEVLKNGTLEEKVKDFLSRLPLLSAFNVKYIYSLIPLEDSRLEEVKLRLIDDLPITIHLYENKAVLSRVYFAKQVRFFAGKENELLLEMAGTKDFKEVTLLECAVCPPPAPGKNSVEIERYTNGELKARVDSKNGGWLIFGESYMPGWEARIDGGETSIYRANYILQGVYIPPGDHDVQFIYQGVLVAKWNTLQKFLDPK